MPNLTIRANRYERMDRATDEPTLNKEKIHFYKC